MVVVASSVSRALLSDAGRGEDFQFKAPSLRQDSIH